MEPFIAEISIFANAFAPRGWVYCEGQLLSIAQNTALFSLLGTTYGGNGQTTFALPDLRGRSPMHAGQGPGLTSRNLGELSGVASVALTQSNLPPHTHGLQGTNNIADSAAPSLSVTPANGGAAQLYSQAGAPTPMQQPLSVAGAGAPHENRQPYLALKFAIALQGIYPPRS